MFVFRRGIPAQPILSGYCGSYDQGMPKSMIDDPMFNYEKPVWINVKTSSEKPSSIISPLTNVATSVALRSLLIIATFLVVHLLKYYR